MNAFSVKEKLDVTSVSLLTALCMVWGLNAVAIKIANVGIDPIFGAGLRSVIATACLILWMRFKRIPLFAGNLLDGIVVGLLFGVEFSILYPSLLYTTASSAWILLYTTPFFHAIGAHFFLLPFNCVCTLIYKKASSGGRAESPTEVLASCLVGQRKIHPTG